MEYLSGHNLKALNLMQFSYHALNILSKRMIYMDSME